MSRKARERQPRRQPEKTEQPVTSEAPRRRPIDRETPADASELGQLPAQPPTPEEFMAKGFSREASVKMANGFRIAHRAAAADVAAGRALGASPVHENPAVRPAPMPKDETRRERLQKRQERTERKAQALAELAKERGEEPGMLHRGAPDLDGTAPNGRD